MRQTRFTPASFALGLAVTATGAVPALGIDLQFTEHAISITSDVADSIFASDLDGDGDTDVLSASFGGNRINWYENDGGSPPTFTERVVSVIANGAESVYATDVDGDGDIDILSASSGDDKIAWYENDGGLPPTFTERVVTTGASGATSVFATDVDGDGDVDIFSTSHIDNTIAWYASDGGSPPTFTERVISTTSGSAQSVFATDVDGDGDVDVVSASFLDNTIVWHESDGGTVPTFTERIISSTATGAEFVFAIDVDSDGDVDVLSASSGDNTIAWYENDGGLLPSFTEHVISTSAIHAVSVFATDLDGDGDIDVLSASSVDDKVAWFESDGAVPPNFVEHVVSATADGAFSVFATDIDGDGDTDVLSASLLDDKVAWYESTTQPVPTVSQWGLVTMLLLLLTAGTIVYTKRFHVRHLEDVGDA